MIFFGVVILVFVVAGLVIAEWDSAKMMFHSSEDVKITIGGVDYSLQNASDLGLISGNSGSLPLKFEVYNSDTTAYVCVEKDLEEYCGDEDGCTIRILMQHEVSATDEVHIVEENIYMEQTDLSKNNGEGLHGYTYELGGWTHGWITGTSTQYDIAYPWNWMWIKNYKHDYCEGQVGNGPAFTNPYEFSFMSHPHVRTNIIVYD